MWMPIGNKENRVTEERMSDVVSFPSNWIYLHEPKVLTPLKLMTIRWLFSVWNTPLSYVISEQIQYFKFLLLILIISFWLTLTVEKETRAMSEEGCFSVFSVAFEQVFAWKLRSILRWSALCKIPQFDLISWCGNCAFPQSFYTRKLAEISEDLFRKFGIPKFKFI